MTVIDVPALDLAPTVPSRIVYGSVLIPTEDRGPQGEWLEASIQGEIKLPNEHATVTGRSKRFPVNPDGSFQLRLPTIAAGIEPEDWALSMRLSWRKFPFPMRVPVGDEPIWIEDCIFPELMPSEDPAQYFLAGAQVRSVQTLDPGASAWAKSDVVGGVLSIDLGIPQGPQGLPGVTAIEGDEAVAGYISTQGQSATRDALMNTLTTVGTRPVGKGEIVLNARDMGALGDGTTDDTAALQAALDASASRDVFLPHGRYRITQTLTVPSGGVVRGENGTVLVNDADLPTMIEIRGSVGTERRIATAVGTNDREITTATAHGFAPGDVVRFKSQRVSTSDDAGEWRLGFAAGSLPGPMFGEFGTVQNVTSDTTFVLDNGLVFPSYRPDANQETDPAAGPFASVARVDGARNILVSTLELDGPASTAVRAIHAVDLRIENLRYVKPDEGRFIQFQECYRSVARECWVTNEVEVTPDLDHAAVNSFHIAASQSTGFDACTAISGTQAYDITYNQSSRLPSSFCFVTNSSSFSALDNHMTVHPGTYSATIVGNNFSEAARSGVSIRGNRTLFANNTLRGSGDRYGLYISEGGGKDSLITGNVISNFDVGLSVMDGGTKTFTGWTGVTFSNNTVLDCQVGYQRYLGWQRPLQDSAEGITLRGNSFTSDRPDAIGVDTGHQGRVAWGLTIQGNSFRLSGSGFTTGVLLTSNARGVSVLDNTFWKAYRPLRLDASASPLWSTPIVTDFTGNVLHDVADTAVPENTASWQLRSEDTTPHISREPHLDLYTETACITTSANESVTFAAGFPVENLPVIVKAVKRLGSMTYQTVEVSTGEMYFRRRSGASWNSWSKRY